MNHQISQSIKFLKKTISFFLIAAMALSLVAPTEVYPSDEYKRCFSDFNRLTRYYDFGGREVKQAGREQMAFVLAHYLADQALYQGFNVPHDRFLKSAVLNEEETRERNRQGLSFVFGTFALALLPFQTGIPLFGLGILKEYHSNSRIYYEDFNGDARLLSPTQLSIIRSVFEERGVQVLESMGERHLKRWIADYTKGRAYTLNQIKSEVSKIR